MKGSSSHPQKKITSEEFTNPFAAENLDLRAQLRTARREIETVRKRLHSAEGALERARTELKASRLRHDQFYDAAPVGYLDIDESGTILYANFTAARLLHYPGSNFLAGKPFSLFLRGDDTLRFSEHLGFCVINEQRHRVQLTIHPRDHPPFSVFLASGPIFEKGRPTICRSVIVDNAAEVTLLESYTEHVSRKQVTPRDDDRERDLMRLVLSHSPLLIGVAEGVELRVTWLNNAGNQAIGGAQGSVGQPLRELLPTFFERISPFIEQVRQTSRPISVSEVLLPIRGSERWFQLSIAPLSNVVPNPFGIVLIALDITETKRSAEALASSENRLRLALIAAGMATCEWNLRDHTISWGGNHHQLFGFAPLQTRNTYHALKALVLEDDLAAFDDAIQRASSKGGEFAVEFRVRWPDGSLHWLQLQGHIFLDESERAVRAMGVLIETSPHKQLEISMRQNQDELESRVRERTTELASAISALRREAVARKNAQRARDDLVRQLAAAQEDERRRISRELHDETGQHLTALLLGLKNLQPSIQSPPAREQLNKLQQLAAHLGEEIHKIAVQLRPTALDDLGLEKTLTNFLDEWSARSHVAVDFHCEGLAQSRLPSEIETVLYRIVQEGLTNVARHANAKNVCVVLQRHPGFVSLIVEDDGKGFDVHSALKRPRDHGVDRVHLGLRSMKERLALVGGELEVESFLSSGTTLFVRIPLPRTRKSQA
jgi:PAS domain S-box-containing protein